MKLRDYQKDAVYAIRDAWRTYDDTLLVAATGAGKTNMFLALLLGCGDVPGVLTAGKRGLILAHRTELMTQPLARIGQYWPHLLGNVGIVQADRDEYNRALTIASVQTLANPTRLDRILQCGAMDYLIIDECHHATARTYMATYEALKAANPGMKHLGVTATPIRADGEGLASVYQHVAANISIRDLVKAGYLVHPRWLGIATDVSLRGVATNKSDYNLKSLANVFDTSAMWELVVQTHKQYADGRKAIVFTVSVDGAHGMAERFTRYGYRAAAVDGTTPKEHRARILADYKAGRIDVLCNCAVFTEGFDEPSIACVHMARPTRSDSLYMQCIGRGLRPTLGKAQPNEDCLIIDYLPEETRNVVNAGDVLGLPKEVRNKALQQHEERGAVQAGFTFDGEDFDLSGTPLEIVARQIDYLNASPYKWYEKDGWLMLGLGKCSNGIDRILALSPDQEGQRTLFGLARNGAPHWKVVVQQTGDLDELGDIAREKAEKYGNSVLMNKGRSWHNQPATDGQRNYLKRLAPRGAIKQPHALTKAEAADLITYYQARQTLQREGVME